MGSFCYDRNSILHGDKEDPMLPETSVHFSCGDPQLQRLYDEAETKCLGNLRLFGSDPVLVEGGGYNKIWLETQPMGGEMYALRNLEAAWNNTRLFMDHQRSDGRLPGSIQYADGRVEPQFNKYQGFCFPFPALNMYYLTGRDPRVLDQLRDTLIRFDECLWRTRDSNGDGLLESFCVYDTGEDLALRYGDAPCWWEKDEPPEGYAVVPMASMDVMSWSFACRDTLRLISLIRGDGEAEEWEKKAARVASAMKEGLWDEKRGAFFDRDRTGKKVDVLCHNTLRCMYWGSLSPEMACRFVKEHLLNPKEFFTPFPLPSVSVSDPLFRNAPENNWSGQSEALTYQRAISALEDYGFHPLVSRLGDIFLRALIRGGYRFTQQYDPFTGVPSLVHAETHQPVSPGSGEPVQDAYGPALLTALEFIARRRGIRPYLDRVFFSLGSGIPCEYTAVFSGHTWSIRNDGRRAEIRQDTCPPLSFPCGIRVITDLRGRVLKTLPIE